MNRPRKIQEVMEVETGLVLNADEIFSGTREESHTFRNRVEDAYQRGEVLFTCLICKQPVYISGTPTQDYTFKHRHELGDCPIKTKGKYSQDEIDRMRFNGVKEGKRHREIKEFVVAMLNNDHRFTDVEPEKVVKSEGLDKSWRKPDVFSVMGERNLVWEIQLATTYHNVIAARERFYQDKGDYIIWLFNQFDPNFQRFTEMDVFWRNKANVFIVDERAMRLSRDRGELVLQCFFCTPYAENGEMGDRWQATDITIGDLKFDPETKKPYFFDRSAVKQTVQRELAADLLLEFEEYWGRRYLLDWEERDRYDAMYCRRLSELLREPIEKFDHSLGALLTAIFSAKHRQPYGTRMNSLLAVANNFLDHHTQYILAFRAATGVYGSRDLLLDADKRKGNFKKKWGSLVKRRSLENLKSEQDGSPNELLELIFPEMAEYLSCPNQTG